jgi:hypothetical protein
MIILFDILPCMSGAERVTVTLPADLVEQIDRLDAADLAPFTFVILFDVPGVVDARLVDEGPELVATAGEWRFISRLASRTSEARRPAVRMRPISSGLFRTTAITLIMLEFWAQIFPHG